MLRTAELHGLCSVKDPKCFGRSHDNRYVVLYQSQQELEGSNAFRYLYDQ